VPTELGKIVANYKETGNQMAVSKEDWVETLQWCEEEMAEEVPGLKIPIDKKGAKIMYTVNAREPKFYPQDIMQAAKIFHAAGEDWTVPSETGWCNTNMAMYAGDLATAKMLAANAFGRAELLGARQIVITECGHAFRSLKYEAPLWLGYTPKQEVVHSIELFHDYLQEGRIKLKSRLKAPTTVQDPCNVCRNGGLSLKNRRLTEMLCEDFRPMSHQGNYNYCCSGGGGAMAMGSEARKQRLQAGKIKAEQIKATGAEIVLTGCHNCIDQIRDLSKEYGLGIKALHFKEVIAEQMEV
jgi:Fe-S oxidoreductase